MAKAVDKSVALRQAALTITSELALDAVLKKIIDSARNLAQARYAALGVAREDRRGLSRFIVSGVTEEEIAAIGDWPRGLGMLGLLLRDPRPVRVRRIREHPASIGFPPRHPEMTSFLGVPVISKGKIFGNFYMTDKIGAEEFTKEDEDLIVAFAAFTAVAIDNARLYSETEAQLRGKLEELERVTLQSRFLVELSALLPTGPLAEELPFEEVLSRTTTLLGDAAAAYLVGPDGTITKKIIVHRVPARTVAADDFVKESWDFIRDQAIEQGNSIFVADVEAISRTRPAFEVREMREHKFSAAIALPIKSAKQVYGVFLSLASEPLRLSQEDLRFSILFANRLATAIENSNLLRELTEALKARDEFISIATHELKTPAAVLVGYADIAMKSAEPSPQLRPVLDTIKRQSTRLAQLANELLDVSRIRAGRLDLAIERVNLSVLVAEMVQRFEAQLSPEDKARLKLDVRAKDLWGEWDPLRLEQVLVNLLSNALKYSPAGGDVLVFVDRIDRQAKISVKDNGVGIPRDQQERIFEPFFRATTAAQTKTAGAGLGLYICKEIVERHGGRMWFESEAGKGSTFYFTLPVYQGMSPDGREEEDVQRANKG